MPAPDLDAVKAYLGTDSSWEDDQVQAALDAETRAQVRVCTITTDPDTGDYDPDLAEALFRRVAHNLALRALPLGVQASITDGAIATNNVGGTDAEVRRLEGPYRRRSVG